MKVESLLEKLKRERMSAMTSSFTYGSKAQEAMFNDDLELAKTYRNAYDKYNKKVERLSITIEEIEKRV